MSHSEPGIWPEPRSLILPPPDAQAAQEAAAGLASWDLTPRQLCELELLVTGALTPLTGYLERQDHTSVLERCRLADGTPWPWPLALDVSVAFAEQLAPDQNIALRDPEGLLIALLQVSSIWRPDPAAISAALFSEGPAGQAGRDWLAEQALPMRLGGIVHGVGTPIHYDFGSLRAGPVELRRRFGRMGWGRTLGFSTRDIIGPGEHALLQRTVRELEANLLVMPETGMEAPDDIAYYARVRALERILPRFSEQSTQLALVPMPRSLGSPRERLLRYVVARNCGCTELLSTPEHGAVALNGEQALCDALGLSVLTRQPLVYLPERGRFSTREDLPAEASWQHCDAAELRQRLGAGDALPDWLAWPELIEELQHAFPPRSQQGFTVFLTGLSGSGKSTIARALVGKLMELGARRVTLLDGDIVRKHLSSELGFSREHRDLNIMRIGFVAGEITKNGGIAICAPIAPYAATRRSVRAMTEAHGGFIEIHVATPLEVCEARDRKGLYARARSGAITEFTGISDPYETPANPELSIDTTDGSPDEAAQQILLKLAGLGYL